MLKPSWPFKAMWCGNVCCTHGNKIHKTVEVTKVQGCKLSMHKVAKMQQTATTLCSGKGAKLGAKLAECKASWVQGMLLAHLQNVM